MRKCGSCGERDGTIVLAASGLRRCVQCFEAMGLEAKHAREVIKPPAIPSTPPDPPFHSVRTLAAKAIADFKQRAGGDAA